MLPASLFKELTILKFLNKAKRNGSPSKEKLK
jgi:hypothetical protein